VNIEFIEEGHIYKVDGVVVPSVTQVLDGLYDLSKFSPDTLETARQKGIAVHKMVELDCLKKLDEQALPEWMLPVFIQWRKFVAESGFKFMESECVVYHPTYRYAGTLDLYGSVKGRLAIIDIKRSFAAGPTIGLQMAAYAAAKYNDTKLPDLDRYALKLNENGPYRLEPFTDKSDFTTFLSLLTIKNWKRKHSL